MLDSTIPYHVLSLTPNRFLKMLNEKKVKLIQPSNRLINKTIQKVLGNGETLNRKSTEFSFCKN